MKSCLRRTRAFISVIKAIISRTLFALHGFICIWRVTIVKSNPHYWWLASTILFIVTETIVTLAVKQGGEWKWVCPSVLLYLATAVPAIWFLELDLMDARVMTSRSSPGVIVTHINTSEEDAISSVLNEKLLKSISLGREEWCKILEQLLLLILIIGRWLLPKGEITREQLSQLLLVYIGMAADIIELFEAFKEEGVRENFTLTLVILGLWTASLTQFTFVLTATKAKRMRPVLIHSNSASSNASVGFKLSWCPGRCRKITCPTEVMSIIISMMLQDAPFLILRMMLIFRYDVLSYTNIFFTAKNSLVLILQFYRLVVLFNQKKKDEKKKREKQLSQGTLDYDDDLQYIDTTRSPGGRQTSRGGGGRKRMKETLPRIHSYSNHSRYGSVSKRKVKKVAEPDFSSSTSEIVKFSQDEVTSEEDDYVIEDNGDVYRYRNERGRERERAERGKNRGGSRRERENSPTSARRASFVHQRAVDEEREVFDIEDELEAEREDNGESPRTPTTERRRTRQSRMETEHTTSRSSQNTTTGDTSHGDQSPKSPPRPRSLRQTRSTPSQQSRVGVHGRRRMALSEEDSTRGSMSGDSSRDNYILQRERDRRLNSRTQSGSSLRKYPTASSTTAINKKLQKSSSPSTASLRSARSKGQGQRRQGQGHWKDVESLAKAVALLNETGSCKTLVLRPVDRPGGQTVFVVDSDPEELADIGLL